MLIDSLYYELGLRTQELEAGATRVEAADARIAASAQAAEDAVTALVEELMTTPEGAAAVEQAYREMTAALDPLMARLTAGTGGSARFSEGLRRLAQQEAEAAVRAADLARPLDGLTSRLSFATSGAARWEEGLRRLAVAQQAGAVAGQQQAAGLQLTGAAGEKIRGGLLGLASAATGTNEKVGQLVTGLLLLGAGSTVVAGVAAGVAVIAAAYRALTKEAREAEEASTRASAAVEQLLNARAGPLPALFQQADDLRATVARLEALGNRTSTNAKTGETSRRGLSPSEQADLDQARADLANATNEIARARQKRLADQEQAGAEAETAARRFSVSIAEALVQGTATLVDDLALALGNLESEFRAVQANLSADAIAQGEARLADLRAQLRAIQDAESRPTLRPVARIDANPQVRRGETDELADAARDAVAAVDDQRRAWEATQAAIAAARQEVRLQADAIVRTVRAALQIADAFGLVERRVAGALEGIAQVAGELQVIAASGFNLSSALTLAGGFASILGGLFGESADAKRDREIREQNTRAIRELTKAFEGSVRGSTVTGARQAVTALLGNQDALAGPFIGLGGEGRELNRDAVRRLLEPLGLTLREFKDLLKEINPDLKLNTSSAADFVESLKQVRKALKEIEFRAFAESFAGELAYLQARANLLDLTNPIDQLAAIQQAAAGKFGSPVLTEALAGLDLTTAAGQDEATRRLLELLDQLNSPDGLSDTQLGGLSSEELANLINEIAGLLDQLKSGGTTGGGPRQETFGAVRGITEVTGSRLGGLLTSIDLHVVEGVAVQREIRDLLARALGPATPIAPPAFAAAPGGLTIIIEQLVLPATTPATGLAAAGKTVGQGLLETLGSSYRSRQLLLGQTVVAR